MKNGKITSNIITQNNMAQEGSEMIDAEQNLK